MSNEYLNNKYLEGVIAKFQKAKKEKAQYEILISNLTQAPDRRVCGLDGQGLVSLDDCRNEIAKVEASYIELQNLLAVAFFTLSDNLARYAKFSHIDIDDAIQEGVMICFEKIDRFDPNYRNANGQTAKAFNYLTTCILNHFRQLYRTARNYNELKKKYHDHLQTQVEQAMLKKSRDRGNLLNKHSWAND